MTSPPDRDRRQDYGGMISGLMSIEARLSLALSTARLQLPDRIDLAASSTKGLL
jgi:hypothetical protein